MTEPEIDDFDLFWKAYPRKDNKKKARVTWNRLSKTNRAKVMEDIQTRYEGVQKCFIPYPTTYLNGERWEDDPIPREEEKPTGPATFHPSHREFDKPKSKKITPDLTMDFTLKGLTGEK